MAKPFSLYTLIPLPKSYVIFGAFWMSSGRAQLSRFPQPLCSLHWQRCELCPHKDGALKRTDNGGEGSPEHLLRSARPPEQVWGGGWLSLLWLVPEGCGSRGQSTAWCWGEWGLVLAILLRPFHTLPQAGPTWCVLSTSRRCSLPTCSPWSPSCCSTCLMIASTRSAAPY